MKIPKTPVVLIGAAALVFSMSTPAVADDGELVRKSMSHEGNLESGNVTSVPGYINENEHAFISMMKFYVPSQASDGQVGLPKSIDYYNVDKKLVETRTSAKPLIGVYINGPVEEVEGEPVEGEEPETIGFSGHGKRDAYASVSLDDGVSWKNTNLSESADEISSDVVRTDIPLFPVVLEDPDGEEGPEEPQPTPNYPGDVTNVFHSVAGNNVLVAWQSRFCASGQPNYSLDNGDPLVEQKRRAAIADYLDIDLATASPDDLYLIDMFKVGGSQGSVDYAEDKWEQNWPVGVVPFNCLWTARGELVADDDPRTDAIESSYMRWFKPERLTSGRRDVNRIETVCVAGAGCAITWQEDPDGLRPGQGEGPGEGWSGAIANSKTDIWYSYIDMEHFDVVQDPADELGTTPMEFLDYEEAAAGDITQKPKPFVPFAMPMRLTDNDICNVDNPAPYCNGSALEGKFPDLPVPMDYGLKDTCESIISVPTGHLDETTQEPVYKDVCVTEDDVPLLGNTASTRPRLGLYGYDSTGKVTDAVIDSAFVVVVAEEDKGLGKFGFTETRTPCTPPSSHDDEEVVYEETGAPVPADVTEATEEECIPFDEGKNMWYHTFSMSVTDTMTKKKDGLLANLVFHGNMLNQPEVDWTTGEFYPAANTANLWDFDTDYDIYNTEIARRGSLLAQDIYKAVGATSKLISLPTWKQGTMNQGGPADVMSRRIVMPRNWTLDQSGNPYAFRNMACKKWLYEDGSNPHYPDGLCVDPAVNLSATIPDTCVDTDTDGATDCPTVKLGTSTFGIGDTNPILQGKELDDGDEATKDSNTDKVLSWHQCPASFTRVTATDGTELVTCRNDARTDASTLADQSWYNPLDVAKGHRGFLDGDFVMMLYAWSPNWRLNAKGSDRYELYIRRSFNGAMTWGTLPSSFTATDRNTYKGDGTVTCETYRSAETGSDKVEPRVCNKYAAGAPEQARNVTQLKSMKTTTLDPRFAMTGSPQGVSNTSEWFVDDTGQMDLSDPYSEDVRDPSRYFVVYETGDNTTTALGEPEPLDLFYSRAVNFGDEYQVWAEETDLSNCYPSDPHLVTDVPTELVGSGFCNEFDQLDQGTPGLEASEASLAANPGGEFLYAAWAQLEHDKDTGLLTGSDAFARRVWWIDGWYSPTDAWVFGQGTGTGTPANP